MDARDLLPLKPIVFEILVALSNGERHGWALVRDVQQRTGDTRIMPANFYRTLRSLLADGLIGKADGGSGEGRDRQYFKLTALGRDAARLEARRLRDLMADARTRRLLSSRKP